MTRQASITSMKYHTESDHSAGKRTRSRKGAPGILDVAARAGVSGATVSRYFNSPDVVRLPTREKIAKAAAELGYIRDRMAGVLHGKRSGTVGLIVPTIDHAIFSELIEAFSSQLLEHDCTMLIASHNYNLDREVGIVRSLLERRIDALALVGSEHALAATEMVKVRDIPIVTLWNAEGVAGIPSIGTDNREGAFNITKHLLTLGHRHLALLFPETKANDRARDRKAGVVQALELAGISIPENWDIQCSYDIDTSKAIALKLLSRQAPTAIVCGNDVIAHGVIHAAKRLNIAIPEQLSVAGFGDFKGSSAIEPALTTVRLPARRIGQQAARLLMSKVNNQNAGTANHIIPAQLIIRDSCGIAPSEESR